MIRRVTAWTSEIQGILAQLESLEIQELVEQTCKSPRGLIQKAYDLVLSAHSNQTHSGGMDYVEHLRDTVRILHKHGYFGEVISAAAWLHDILENTPVTEDQIRNEFGEEICRIVKFCTDEPGESRKERKHKTHRRMATQLANRTQGDFWQNNAIRVKLADRLANIYRSIEDGSSLLKAYREESSVFVFVLRTTGVCDSMWEEYDIAMQSFQKKQ